MTASYPSRPSEMHNKQHKEYEQMQDFLIPSLSAMLKQEVSYQPSDYLFHTHGKDSVPHKSSSMHVSDSWRRKICEWKYQIVDYYNIDREVVVVSMNYLDRYLSLSDLKKIEKRHFQLAAMTCLFMSTKLFEPSSYEVGKNGVLVRRRNVLPISALVELSRDYFDRISFVEMEQRILFKLQWKVSPPTSLSFVSHWMEILRASVPDSKLSADDECALSDLARYLCELSVCMYDLSTQYAQSNIALAAIWNAIEQTSCNNARFSKDLLYQFASLVQETVNIRLDLDTNIRAVYNALKQLRPGNGQSTGDTKNNTSQEQEDVNMSSSPSIQSEVSSDHSSPICVSKAHDAQEKINAESSKTETCNETNMNTHEVKEVSAPSSLNEPPKVHRETSKCPWDTLVPSNSQNKQHINHQLKHESSKDFDEHSRSVFRKSPSQWITTNRVGGKVHPVNSCSSV